MNRFILLLLLIFICTSGLFSQKPDTIAVPDTVSLIVPGKIIDGDTVPVVVVKSAYVYPPYKFKNRRHRIRYTKLVYNVRKVYPYAKLAGEKLKAFQKGLDTITGKREQRKYLKEAEKLLEEEFGDEIRKLTFSQGKILIKLIYRQTGSTSYEIVRELRGKFTAFIWQTMASIFGYNLKKGYDPEGEDRQIEDIIILIEEGYF